MRFSTLALAGALTLVAGSALADDPMANTYSNSVMTKSAKSGQSATLLFNSDGTYMTKGMDASGKAVQYPGKWELKDGGKTICLTPELPPNTPNAPPPSCSALETHNVGDSWSVTNDQGETFEVSITAGR
jgi:hypothetical protein